jgi:2-(1,2-epoxy-1,2-dihydrophenyl)acetyl-CoA isomerase
MKHGRILLETVGNVAVMTLNDPSVLNAFGFKLRQDMTAALDAVEAGEVRCLLITGAGQAFCSGANLNDRDRPIWRPGTTPPSCACAPCPSRS